MLYGRDDLFLLVDGLDGVWSLIDNAPRVEVLHGAGHFAMNDAPATFNALLRDWLTG